jgi:FkbM family methyltransferase
MYYHDFKNDEFVHKYIFNGIQNGYFVEIGACDGIKFSQCYFFEKELGWNGIAVEPQKRFSDILTKNRKTTCTKCIGNKNTVVHFTESLYYGLSGVTEALIEQESFDKNKTGWRNSILNYPVQMVTLIDLLEEYASPKIIEYLAMDCEGSEYNILSHFFANNNNRYKIIFIAIEVGRNDIIQLLLNNNYIEIINPYLNDITFNETKVTWEKYFILESEIDKITDKSIRTYVK